jgi:hypothetical protein
MEKMLNIKHSSTTFLNRSKFLVGVLVLILLLFLILFILENGIENINTSMSIFALVFGSIILFKVWLNKIYLADIECDSNIINIRYFNGKVEHNLSSYLDNTNIELKNTSTRMGFDCKLRLRIDSKKFIIDDTFDWSLSEMKLLFEYIKHYKNESLTETDKFNISKIEERIKKNALQHRV